MVIIIIILIIIIVIIIIIIMSRMTTIRMMITVMMIDPGLLIITTLPLLTFTSYDSERWCPWRWWWQWWWWWWWYWMRSPAPTPSEPSQLWLWRFFSKPSFDDWPPALDISQAVDTKARSGKILTMTRCLHLDFFRTHLQDFWRIPTSISCQASDVVHRKADMINGIGSTRIILMAKKELKRMNHFWTSWIPKIYQVQSPNGV